MNSDNLKIGGGYILISLLWGSTWLAIRIGLDSITPFAAAGIRFTLASLFVYGVMKLNGVKLQTEKEFVKIYLFLGFFSFVIPFGLVYWAEQFIPSGLASVLFGAFPFFVIIFSRIFIPNDRVGIYKFLGVVFGFIGIYIIFAENLEIQFGNYIWGMFAVLGSAAMQGGIAVFIKLKGKNLNPLSMNLVPLFVAGISLLIISYFIENVSQITLEWKGVLSVIYLAFFGTVITFTVYYWLMKKINVVILSLTSFITPIIALLLGWLILDEKLTTNVVWGSGMVLLGILIANFRGLIKYFYQKKSAVLNGHN